MFLMRYQQKIHNPDSLQEQLDTIQRQNPDIRIVGSLGRSVLFGLIAHDPEIEYHTRSQKPLYDHSGQARDIDVIGLSNTTDTGSFPVDNIAFDNKSVSIWKHGSDWWLRSIDKKFSEQLHPDVMAPIIGTGTSNITAITVPLQTHLALTLSRGILRDQDNLSRYLLENVGRAQQHSLPTSLYKPFYDLSRMSHDTPLSTPRYVYRRFFPAKAKKAIDPLLKSAGIIPSKGLHDEY